MQRVQRDRLATLALTARLVASFPELKALFATDAATIRDYLVSYQQRNPGAPLLVGARRPREAASRVPTTPPRETSDDWIEAAGAQERTGGRRMRDRPYPRRRGGGRAGGNVFGQVVAAHADRRGVRRGAQGSDAGRSAAAVGPRRAGVDAARRANAVALARRVARAGGRPIGRPVVDIGVQRFAAREVVLAEQPALSAVILKSRDEAIEPFRRIQKGDRCSSAC